MALAWLGLRLVPLLAQQINGEIEVRNIPGAEFVLTFMEPPGKPVATPEPAAATGSLVAAGV